MSRKNNLKRRKQTVEYQQKREIDLAKKQRAKQERKRDAMEVKSTRREESLDDNDIEMDGVVTEDVRDKLTEIKNPKMRRRMENEIRRLATKGIVVKRKADRAKAAPKASKASKDTKE
mmetsp:Transcript_1787/g.4159  ORF Transcript_1787/g.4159 Transcript_1787/m.4159 type:complete len:118 (+) Transcript_1787:211-564(+)